ncbi:trypsin 3A1-like isoform X2 [Belonocnema kinseyi]|uniref:trypsin 3A1-like isoform X2 n=1 Tax=Belonocnema kinseyi TaxID=2817044 RepID=UPI00143CE42B|nr:trypsin 3A1-like isoform X2 [Belonocnema kinseyi]
MNTNILIILTLLVTTNAYRIHRNSSLNLPAGLNFSESDDRIIGGLYADIREFPYLVALIIFGKAACGGSIISEDWVLSAAHCLENRLIKKCLTIRSGSSTWPTGGTIHEATETILHEGYSANQHSVHNDIGLIKVNPKFQFNEYICQAIPLINAGEKTEPGTLARTGGWGRTQHDIYPEHLFKVYVPILSRKECDSYFPSPLPMGQICAGFKEGSFDSCDGDSGGPLSVGNLLVGIVSWGNGCGKPYAPGVYAEVAYYRNWIKQKTGI